MGAVRGLTLAEKARRASALSLPLLFLAGGKTPGTGGSAGGSAKRGARLGPVPLPGESKPQGCRGRLSGLCACCCDRAGLGNGLGRKQTRQQGQLPLPRSSEAAGLGGRKAASLPCPLQHPQPNPPGMENGGFLLFSSMIENNNLPGAGEMLGARTACPPGGCSGLGAPAPGAWSSAKGRAFGPAAGGADKSQRAPGRSIGRSQNLGD